uniref:Uncharacterized protein n=1 Tax=Macaca mulatta TaxID=9544 RepID=A0A5F8AJH1_MACMU
AVGGEASTESTAPSIGWRVLQSCPGPGAVAHICNPSTLGGRGDRPPDVRSPRPAWPTWRNPVSTTNTKICWVWWWVPVVPATQEAEAGESFEPRRWGFTVLARMVLISQTRDPPPSASQSAGITGINHHAQPTI